MRDELSHVFKDDAGLTVEEVDAVICKAPAGPDELRRLADRRRQINERGDELFSARVNTMGVNELQNASTMRGRARQLQNEADAAVRNDGDRRRAGPARGRTYVEGYYRTVRGQRFWIPGFYRIASQGRNR